MFSGRISGMSMKGKPIPALYGDAEYKIVCDRGLASLEGLRQALENGLEADGWIQSGGDQEAWPMISATVGFGMPEHTKLLLAHGADVNVKFVGRTNSAGEEEIIGLGQHCITSMSKCSGEEKIRMFEALEEAGLDWIGDQDGNVLHGFLSRTDMYINDDIVHNGKLFSHVIQNPRIEQLDLNQQNKRYFVEAAIICNDYGYALAGLKRGLCQRSGLTEHGLIWQLATTFEGISRPLWPLTEALLEEREAREEFMTMDQDLEKHQGELTVEGQAEFSKWISFARKICLKALVPVGQKGTAQEVRPKI